jgi:hypothetical protein
MTSYSLSSALRMAASDTELPIRGTFQIRDLDQNVTTECAAWVCGLGSWA